MDEIAANLLTVMVEQATPSVWSSIRQNENGWLEFVISQRGIDQWQQQLTPQTLRQVDHGQPYGLEPEKLWQLQSGYELCCRWQANYRQLGGDPQVPPENSSVTMFRMPNSPLHQLIHGLLDICDGWDEATLPRLSLMSQRLVGALEQCTAATTPASSEAGTVSRWLGSTQVVLKQLINERLRYQLTECF